MKRIMSLFLAAAMMFSLLAACGDSNGGGGGEGVTATAAPTNAPTEAPATQPAGETEKDETPAVTEPVSAPPTDDAVNLVFLLLADWGGKPNRMDNILEEFHRQTKEELNMNVEFLWLDDYFTALQMKLSAGEQVDSAFDAPWAYMETFASHGTYMQIDKYFHNDAYPGLKATFSETFMKNNMIGGKSYGIPLTQYFGNVDGVVIRKDLREKYGLAPLESMADLEHYYDLILQNEPGMIPFGANGYDGYIQVILRDNVIEAEKYNISFEPNSGAMSLLNADKTRILASALWHTESELAALGFPPDANRIFQSHYDFMHRWYEKGYLEKDILSQSDKMAMFKVGKVASYVIGVNTFTGIRDELRDALPGADAEVFVISEAFRSMAPGTITTDFRAWNFQCIPANSKNADRTMQFFDWLFSSQENHDLFEYGIKGVDWEPVGNSGYRVPAGKNPTEVYNMYPYMLTWTPRFIRIPEDIDESLVKYYEYMAREDTYVASSLAGMHYDSSPVETESLKIGAEINDLCIMYGTGVVELTPQKRQEISDRLESLGRQKYLDFHLEETNEALAKVY